MATFIIFVLIFISCMMSSIKSPNVCIWGRSQSPNAIINGEYTYQGTYNSYPLYIKNIDPNWTGDPNGAKTLYLWKSSEQFNLYVITFDAPSTNPQMLAYCGRLNVAEPTQCNISWFFHNGTDFNWDRSVFAAKSCPHWDCDHVIPMILNNACHQDFNLQIAFNAWSTAEGELYWYFVPEIFIFVCRTSYDLTANALINVLAGTNYDQGWTNTTKGTNVSLQFEYPDTNYHVIQCIGNPTPSPTTATPTTMIPITSKPTTTPTTTTSTTLRPTTSKPTMLPIKSKPTTLPTTTTPSTDTTEPTQTPTNAPTSNPTLMSTSVSTSIYTSFISKSPALAPTSSPTNLIIKYDDHQVALTYSTFIYIASCLFVLTVIITLIGYLHLKYYRDFEYEMNVSSLFKFLIYLLDFISDLFFCIHLYYYINVDHVFLALFVSSLIFLFLPSIVSLYEMDKFTSRYIKQYQNDLNMADYFEKHTFLLYSVCFLTGNFDATLSVFSCKLFNLDIFGISINRKEKVWITNKYAMQSIVFENLPQLIQSIVYSTHRFYKFGNGVNDIAIFTYIFGIISIIISIFAFRTRRKLLQYSTIHQTLSESIQMDAYNKLDGDL